MYSMSWETRVQETMALLTYTPEQESMVRKAVEALMECFATQDTTQAQRIVFHLQQLGVHLTNNSAPPIDMAPPL